MTQAQTLPESPERPADASASGFRLLIEANGGGEFSELPIDPGRITLSFDSDGALALTQPRNEVDRASVLLEPIELDHRPALVLVAPPGGRVRVNGIAAPPLALLAVGDVLQLKDRELHVSWFRNAQVGPPPPALIGERCPVCLTPVTPDTTVVVHDCGRPLHVEPHEGGLQCALLGDCLECGRPVVLEAGLEYRPDR